METLDSPPRPPVPVDYAQNPDFSFPQRPEDDVSPTNYIPRRTASLHINPTTPQRRPLFEPKSVSTLPSFSFNAADTSGRLDSPSDAYGSSNATPSLAVGSIGHRRRASELVGGSARHGNSDLISASPMQRFDLTTSTPSSFGSPRKRGHVHRRSDAASTHDLKNILQPRDTNISDSQPIVDDDIAIDLDEPSPEPRPSLNTARPPLSFAMARPRVGFSSNVEIIPRPLSTISSEAESIMSAAGASSPPLSSTSPSRSANLHSSRRRSRSARSSLSEVEFAASMSPSPSARTSFDHPGDLLQNDVERPPTSADFRVAFQETAHPRDFSFPPARTRINHLDRRRSEPSLTLGSLQKPRRSSVSLREPLQKPQSSPVDSVAMSPRIKKKKSASRVKAWASSVILGKNKKASKKATHLEPEVSPFTERDSFDATTPTSEVQEADLEVLFSHDPFGQSEDESSQSKVGMRMDTSRLTDSYPMASSLDEAGPVIDLDAALGVNKTPSRDGRSPGIAARRHLHSSRANRELSSPGNAYHRRTESAPALTPFDFPKSPSPLHSPMADVFEEEEEEDGTTKSDLADRFTPLASSFPSTPVESARELYANPLVRDEDFSILTAPAISPLQPESISGAMSSTEAAIEIVEAHEEPRASTLTKSSDSSEDRTVLADDEIPMNMPVDTPHIEIAMPEDPERYPSRPIYSFEGTRMGTSASSAADTRTLSSCTSERHDMRSSVDDVPSLTSSRSTMISSMQPTRRDISDPASSTRSRQMSDQQSDQRRRKRASIQGLTKLMSGPFGESKLKLNLEHANQSTPNLLTTKPSAAKSENRLSRLMFWKTRAAKS